MFQSSYHFNDPSLLDEAVTHRSWYNENCRDASAATHGNDRLEFLGDAVLKALQGRHLFESHPDWGEGQLSKTRSYLESNAQLAANCRHLGLDTFIRTGLSIQHAGPKAWDNMCAQAFEAYVGAIWKDCGYDFNFLLDLYQSWNFSSRDQEIVNYKSRLQEHMQKLLCGRYNDVTSSGEKSLLYETLGQEGPSHEPFFSVRCSVVYPSQNHSPRKGGTSKLCGAGSDGKSKSKCQNEEGFGDRESVFHTLGQGTTKKKAESDAARLMLTVLPGVDR